jgi:hypothetical protein
MAGINMIAPSSSYRLPYKEWLAIHKDSVYEICQSLERSLVRLPHLSWNDRDIRKALPYFIYMNSINAYKTDFTYRVRRNAYI